MRARTPLLVGLGVVVVLAAGAVGAVVSTGGDGGDAGDEDGRDRGRAQRPPVAAADAVSSGVAPTDADVVVLGDSVTHQSAAPIVAAMGGRAVSVLGLSGYRSDEILPTVEDALGGDGRPAVAVVLVGYNDVWQGVEDQAAIEETAELLAGVDCAVWVLMPTKGFWDLARAQAFDAHVREVVAAAGVPIEPGWRDAVDAGEDPAPDPNLVQPDRVHPTPAGSQKLAEVMAAAVTRTCG